MVQPKNRTSKKQMTVARARAYQDWLARQRRIRRTCLTLLLAAPVLLLLVLPFTPPAWRFVTGSLGGLVALVAVLVVWRQDQNTVHPPANAPRTKPSP